MVTKGTYYKALILLVVFSMNTTIGFACSISNFFHGMHHHATSTVDKDERNHNQSPGHSHHESTGDDHNDTDDKNCCSSNVVQLEKREKFLSKTIEAPVNSSLSMLFTALSYLYLSFPEEQTTSFIQHFRWWTPATIQDLRIVIQSFQI